MTETKCDVCRETIAEKNCEGIFLGVTYSDLCSGCVKKMRKYEQELKKRGTELFMKRFLNGRAREVVAVMYSKK